MKAAVLVFPGSNCDRDLAEAFRLTGFEVEMVWHKDIALPDRTDVVGVPGGFSFGDYLRCGAIAARAPIADALVRHAGRGGYVLAPCNGFQIVTELGLLPGALIRNAGLTYICDTVGLRVEASSAFTDGWGVGQEIALPIAHHEGNYVVSDDDLARLKDEDRIALRYTATPNGARDDVAGVLSANRRVLGLMPHPERAMEPAHGRTDGMALFRGLADALVAA
ncbi:phosphoribosylformylglycinamidine synthase subunit PurQ [Jannaschia sp. Os4]|uniref:phosphoribosylformylglycinamidine synthase subunit PurQ n=1 Tax=Jannaschia sp. Os4 TaxID=2807617 RepID=UPI00193A30DD|nr:phosphoribosylformylglycinamidine synthase subunit PurQ [Jannaschia sp. Os4]MBM2576837.1 phosphoribosylformylglycinamidine synthase subunit PurQ [Jannaschia sp. Os4]